MQQLTEYSEISEGCIQLLILASFLNDMVGVRTHPKSL